LSRKYSLGHKSTSHGASNPLPYVASLDGIASVYEELQSERERLIRESEQMYRERVSSVSRLRRLEAKLMDLSQEKMSLEEKLEGLGLRDEDLRQKILELDKKVANISLESQRFELVIREMRGEKIDSIESGIAPFQPQRVSSSSCLRTLYGHSAPVLCVDACSKSRIVVTGSADKALRTWDMDTGRRQDALYGHNGWVHSVSLYKHKAVSGSGDKTIKIWDFSPAADGIGYGVGVAGPCQATLVGHDAGVTCIDFDDNHILSGSMDRTIRRWDFHRQNEDVFVLTGHDLAVSCLQLWSYALVSGGVDKAIRMWDLRTGKCHRVLRGHAGAVRCLQFDDTTIVSGGLDKRLLVWDIRTGRTVNAVDVPGQVYGLTFDGKECFVASSDKIVYVYNITRTVPSKELYGHSGAVMCVSQADGKAISGSADQTCRVWI